MKKFLLMVVLLLQSIAAGAAHEKDAPAVRNVPSATAIDHAQIINTVTSFVQQQTAAMPGKAIYQVDAIDRRIVLPKCAGLEAFLPSGSQLIGKTSVGVRCAPTSRKEEANTPQARANGWSIFVPVQIRFTIPLLTSARQLPHGHALQEQDIVSQEVETHRIEGYTDPGQVLGKVLRYGIGAGQMLRENMLRPPYSVKQGQVVPLAVQGDGFSIRSEGVALGNASEGQTVQIRVGAGRVISGVARAGGMVEIAP